MNNLQELFNTINFKINDYNTLLDCAKDLLDYNGNDWQKYITNSNNYQKTLICKSDKIELYVITWMPNSASRIHDHPDKGCLVKILQGELTETEFINNDTLIYYKNTNILKKDDIGFKIKNEILHKINNNTDKIAISLHIYSLPNFKISYY
jgi:cysteine dioxygenase